MAKRAVFLDRDGTINIDTGYTHKASDWRFIERSVDAIRELNKHNIPVVIITNQAGIALGYYPPEAVDELHTFMLKELETFGVRIDGIYFCPHRPDGKVPEYSKQCTCRKPEIDLLVKAAEELDIDLKKSYMVGDKGSDVKAGWNAGAKGILVLTGEGKKTLSKLTQSPDHVAEDLLDAVKWILEDLKSN